MKKIIILSLVTILLIVIGFFAYREITKARLAVSSQEGVEIYISLSKDEPFTQIGTGSASYSLYSPQTVYVRAVKGSQITESPVFMENGQTKDINLPLSSLRTASPVAPGPLSHPYMEGGLTYGVSPISRSSTYYQNSGSQAADPSFTSVADIKNASWRDSSNYTYNSFRYGVGSVIDDIVYDSFFIHDGGEIFFFDFTQVGTGPLYLLENNSIFTATSSAAGDLDLFAGVDRHDVSSISSDSYYVYVSGVDYGQDGEEILDPESSSIHVFNYDGEEVFNFPIYSTEIIYKVAYLSEKDAFVVLESEGLMFIDKSSGKVTRSPRHSGDTQDLLVLNDSPFVLGSDGLWRYDFISDSYHLVSGFKEDEEYVAGSFVTSLQNNSILFSTQLSASVDYSETSPDVGSSVYEIKL